MCGTLTDAKRRKLDRQVQYSQRLISVLRFIGQQQQQWSVLANGSLRAYHPLSDAPDAEFDFEQEPLCQIVQALTRNPSVSRVNRVHDGAVITDEHGHRFEFPLSFLIDEVVVAGSRLLLPGLAFVDVPGFGDTNAARASRVESVLRTVTHGIHVTKVLAVAVFYTNMHARAIGMRALDATVCQ